MSVAKVSEISATSKKAESAGLTTWSLRGRTYVPTTVKRGLEPLDEDRASSMTDEGGPDTLDPIAEASRASGSR